MTCIVALQKDGKIYIGADKRISSPDGSYFDSKESKLLIKDGITFGFAGNRGFQNLFELMLVNIHCINYNELKLKIINILSLFKDCVCEIFMSNGRSLEYINFWNSSIFNLSIKNGINNLYAIGLGKELINNLIPTKFSPEDIIKEAILKVSEKYMAVGNDIEILTVNQTNI